MADAADLKSEADEACGFDSRLRHTASPDCHRALAAGGKLLLVETPVPPDNKPGLVQHMDLNMLVMIGGRERTEAEYRRLLAGAGFRVERIIPTHSPYSVIETTRI
jgi:hypothetical protein